MAGPILTDEEKAQLEKDIIVQKAAAEAFTAAVPLKQARAVELAVTDGAFKKFFDYYNDDIITHYDAERKSLNGQYIAAPIVEADITKVAELDGDHRTTPTLPATDVIRISEFDGSPLIVDNSNETQHIADQAIIEDALVNGYTPAPTITGTTVTDSALTSSSTSLDVVESVGPISFSVNDIFIVSDGVDVAVVKVTGVTDNLGGNPPFDFTLDIELLLAPSGTLAIGSSVIVFSGFTNTERINKVATDSSLQPLMDGLLQKLEDRLNDRVSRLDEQITELNAQQDPDAVAEISTTLGLVNTSKSFINTYLISTDISDTGLASLASERGTRSSEVSTRIAQIVANYTGQTENYFDRRYSIANDRGNTFRGTLRQQKNAEQSAVSSQAFADNAQATVDALEALLS
jgi:hypothetical protein